MSDLPVVRDHWGRSQGESLLTSFYRLACDRWFRANPARLPVEIRIEVQRLLSSAGHYSGPLDGTFGPAAMAGLAAYSGGWGALPHALPGRP